MKHRPLHVTLAAHFAIRTLWDANRCGAILTICVCGMRRTAKGMPIIFLHGWTMDHRDETPVYEPIFAEAPRAIGASIQTCPAWGKARRMQRIKNQDHYLDVALRFIEAMTMGDKRFLLAGTSAGAYLARGVVQRMAERIDGLLLRVPLMVAEDKQARCAEIRALLEDESFMARLSDADRKTYAQFLVHSPHYLKAAQRKQEKQVGAGA